MKTTIPQNRKFKSRLGNAGSLLCAIVIAATAQKSIGQVVIGIEGLDGAEHWVWKEGVNFTSGNGAATFRDNNGVSGWVSGGPNNAYNRTTGSSNVGDVSYSIFAPAAMSAATKVYTRARVNTTAGMTVRVDGSIVSPANTQIVSNGLSNPTQFLGWQVAGAPATPLGQGISTGALTSGSHTFLYTAATYASSGLNSFMVGGLLLYDGNPLLRSTVNNGSGRYWLDNPGSADSPEIGAFGEFFIPEFTINGLSEGNQVYYWLNGVAYNPGTAIGQGLDYELVVEVYANSDPNSQRLAFAGANFSVIPEPTVSGLLLGGVLLSLIGRRRKSS